jgi:hypothetical protein
MAVIYQVFYSFIRHIEPYMQKIHPQHRLYSARRAPPPPKHNGGKRCCHSCI